MLFAPPRTDDDLAVGLHGDDRPILIDRVGIVVPVGGRGDVLDMRARMDRMLLLPIDHEIARFEMHYHSPTIIDGVSQGKLLQETIAPEKGAGMIENDKLQSTA